MKNRLSFWERERQLPRGSLPPFFTLLPNYDVYAAELKSSAQ
jgi:hypothetical protein